MATMFVKHKVSNYENWKKVYDNLSTVRKEKGVTAASVHRDPNDPNTLIVTHRFKTMNAATDFANSQELKSALADSGVVGQPEIWFGDDIESTPF